MGVAREMSEKSDEKNLLVVSINKMKKKVTV
jgi:hypothetical protein